MRYRQLNQQHRSNDQQARDFINSNDVLSTTEQEEVIAYFARSLRSNTQFLKVVVCLHILIALVYLFLLLSGSLLFDLEMSHETTAKLLEVTQQQRQMYTTPRDTSATSTTSPSEPPATQNPLVVLAALDAKQRAAQHKYVQDYLGRRSGSLTRKSITVTNVLSVAVMLYSIGLLLWAARSGYMACRLLHVNVEDLTNTEPRELGRLPSASQKSTSRSNTVSAHSATKRDTVKNTADTLSIHARLRWLRQRIHTDPPVAQYVAAALAAVASFFWFGALLSRQLAMQRAYVAAGLPSPSVLTVSKVTDALLEYVLAVWQPLFHAAIGCILRSMLDTKGSLIELSHMKYSFDKV